MNYNSFLLFFLLYTMNLKCSEKKKIHEWIQLQIIIIIPVYEYTTNTNMNIHRTFFTADMNMNIIQKKYSRLYLNIQIFATLWSRVLTQFPFFCGNKFTQLWVVFRAWGQLVQFNTRDNYQLRNWTCFLMSTLLSNHMLIVLKTK